MTERAVRESHFELSVRDPTFFTGGDSESDRTGRDSTDNPFILYQQLLCVFISNEKSSFFYN